MREGLGYRVGALAWALAWTLAWTLGWTLGASATAQELAGPEGLQGQRFEHPRMTLRLTPRTPQQVAAFYEARGFPPQMVQALKARCFITVGIRNKGEEVLWHRLDTWRFRAAERELQRYDRAHWRARWAEMDAPMPAQSTFRWTLLPETHDFLPQEAEGGNVILERTREPFSLRAVFVAGEAKDGELIEVRLDGLRCAEDPT